MLLPQVHTQLLDSLADGARALSVEHGLGLGAVAHDHGQLRVALALQAAVVDIGAAENGYAIVGDQQLAVHIDLFGDHALAEFFPGAQIEQGQVARPVLVLVDARCIRLPIFRALNDLLRLLWREAQIEIGAKRHAALNTSDQAILAKDEALHGQADLMHDVWHVQRAFRMDRQNQVDMEGLAFIDGATDPIGQSLGDAVQEAGLHLAQFVGDPALGIDPPYGQHVVQKRLRFLARIPGNGIDFGPVQLREVLGGQRCAQLHAFDEVLAQGDWIAQAGHWAGERELFKVQLAFATKRALKKLVLDVDEMLGAGDGLKHRLLAVGLHGSIVDAGW